MTSPWSVANINNLTIPSDAGPGQARIVIGPTLPAPIDTYVPNAVPGLATATGFSGAIVFYSEGDDTTYIYLAVVEDAATQVAGVVFGYVVNGVIQQKNGTPNYPDGIILSATDTIPLFARLALSTDILQMSTQGDQALTLDSNGVTLHAGSGLVNIEGDITWEGAESNREIENALITTTSTAYSLSATVCSVGFTAPPSGKVWAKWRAYQDSTGAGDAGICAIQIRETAGPIFQAANDNCALWAQGTNVYAHGMETLITGLTPGTVYTAELLQRSTNAANTASFQYREVMVEPTF